MGIGKIWRKVMGIPEPTPPTPPMEDRRGWTEDWRVGDLARCIRGDWHVQNEHNPVVGQMLRVSALEEGKVRGANAIVSGLGFEGKPSHLLWHNASFTKIRPDQSADEVEAGIISKIKDCAKQGRAA